VSKSGQDAVRQAVRKKIHRGKLKIKARQHRKTEHEGNQHKTPKQNGNLQVRHLHQILHQVLQQDAGKQITQAYAHVRRLSRTGLFGYNFEILRFTKRRLQAQTNARRICTKNTNERLI
jgi:hypothetical protein